MSPRRLRLLLSALGVLLVCWGVPHLWHEGERVKREQRIEREAERKAAEKAKRDRLWDWLEGKPPRRLKRKQKGKRIKRMATFNFDGQGEVASRGDFVETGTYHTKVAYQFGSYWVTWAPGINSWAMSTTPGTPGATMLYSNPSTGATCPTSGWVTQMGAAPAPTVTEVGGGGGGTSRSHMVL